MSINIWLTTKMNLNKWVTVVNKETLNMSENWWITFRKFEGIIVNEWVRIRMERIWGWMIQGQMESEYHSRLLLISVNHYLFLKHCLSFIQLHHRNQSDIHFHFKYLKQSLSRYFHIIIYFSFEKIRLIIELIKWDFILKIKSSIFNI